MKLARFVGAGMVVWSLACCAQAPASGVQMVSEVNAVDPAASPELQEFKRRVAAAHPGLDVVKVESEVVRRAVLAPPPPPPPSRTPVVAVFVQNRTQVPGMDDQIDGIRDRIAAEMAGLDFVVMDSSEIGAAFNRYKVTTAEERAGLVSGLFTGGSVTRVAQMLDTDYILTVSVIGASRMSRMAGDRRVSIYTLRMATKILDTTTGGSVYGKTWVDKLPTPAGNGDDPMNLYNDLIDRWVQSTSQELAQTSPKWRAPTRFNGKLASFTVTTTIDAEIAKLALTVDATRPVKEELRLVAGGITVEIDGAAVGSSRGVFQVRPGLHQLRVTRQWMQPWEKTVNIQDGAVFDVALELSAAGFQHYRNKEVLRAEVALAYAEAAFRRGCRINFDSSAWKDVAWAPVTGNSSVNSSVNTSTVGGQSAVSSVQAPVAAPSVVPVAPPAPVAPVAPAPAVAVPAAPAVAAPATPKVAF